MRDLLSDAAAEPKSDARSGAAPVPGKATLIEKEFPGQFAPAQAKADGAITAGAVAQEPASGGQALPDPVRGKMERSFGADFSGVRVHEDGRAGALGAQAYAKGEDVHMAPGRYDPSSRSGQALIGHELSHVVQQREGRVAADGQGKDAAVVVDAGLEAEADREGERAADGLSARGPSSAGASAAGAGAPVQGKGIVQLRPGDPNDPPAGRVAASHSFAVPPVIPIAAIPDAVNRNQAINQSYHVIDAAMTGYLGDPLVANWYTFGQHASREAGTQIRNLQMGLQIMSDALPVLQGLAFGNPLHAISSVRSAVRIFQRIIDLMGQDAMVQQAMNLAFQKAGITEAELHRLVREAEFALAGAIGGPIFLGLGVPFIAHVASMTGKMIVAIPPLIRALRLISDNMVTGNREIYENVAPAAHGFLQAASASPTGDVQGYVPAADPSGFMTAAFAEYVEVRKLGDDVRANPTAPDASAKLAQRQQKAAHANLLIGFQEQLVILQPLFNTMQQEMAAMSGTMVLHDPNGAHPLANNWQDFYTRMGIDPRTAPKDPTTITPGNLPPLLPAAQRQGTIASYFNDNLTDEKVHEAPRDIAPG